ncbi:MAG: hypothetical protein ORN53_06655, partial [Crocinitomicaceae bacterium]|nr:hypothetical protein [Crocinitomicaceae bacterium]
MKFSFPTESKKHMRFGLILLRSLIIGLFFMLFNPNKVTKVKKDPYAGLLTRKGNQEIHVQTLLQNKAVPVLKLSNEREKTVKLSRLKITSVVENGVAKTRY